MTSGSPDTRRNGAASGLRARAGFTLIELLVVIAIIAILAAILLPVFARARENARKAACLNNAKQIGMGVMQYTQDFDECYPITRIGAGGAGGGNWAQLVSPYIKSANVFACGSNRAGAQAVLAECNPNYNPPIIPRCYGCNPRVVGANISMASVKSPAGKIMIAEIDASDTWSSLCHSDWADWPGDKRASTHSWAGHMGMGNYIFCDGHAKTLKPSLTMTPTVNMWGWFDTQSDPGAQDRVNDDRYYAGIASAMDDLEKRFQ